MAKLFILLMVAILLLSTLVWYNPEQYTTIALQRIEPELHKHLK